MKPRHWVLVALVAFWGSVVAVGIAVGSRSAVPGRAEDLAVGQHSLAPLYPAPGFAYPDQHGTLTTPATLRGSPYLANFIFTTCRTVCPLLTAKMVQAQRALADVPMHFVSFSVDPDRDTPEALARYHDAWHPGETRWTLLATDARTLPVTVAGFHVTASPSRPGDVDPIIHSSVFLLVDGDGLVRGVYDSERRADWQAALRDVRTLARRPAPPPPPDRSGAELYLQLSCATCHERAELAPALQGLAGRTVELETSQVLTAEAGYVTESILRPDAKRVRGFPLRMPSYEGLVSPGELQALVTYVLALPPEDVGTRAEGTTAVDPVCKMQVRVTADTPSFPADGGRVHFCSEQCRARYAQHPEHFQ